MTTTEAQNSCNWKGPLGPSGPTAAPAGTPGTGCPGPWSGWKISKEETAQITTDNSYC